MPPTESGKFRRKAGRREKPLPDDGNPRTILAARLRELKSACGSPTYGELAARSGVYKTGLIDAARVTRLPPWYVVEGYVEGCWKYSDAKFGTSFADAGDLPRWQQLYREAGGTIRGGCPPRETGNRDEHEHREPQLAPAAAGVLSGYGVAQAQDTSEEPPSLARAPSARRAGRHNRPINVVAGIAAVALLVTVVVAGVTWLRRPVPAGPWTRLSVQPLGSGFRHPLAATTIPAASLQPELADLLAGRIAAGRDVTGYELRSAYPASPPLCLTAVTTGPTAGQDYGGVEASPCTPSARSQIWIPVQYEASGSSYTWLANDQYQSMCLNADNRGGGVHQGSRVQLWNCYPPHPYDFTHFNESWDFGTWLRAMQSGAISYPLFLGAGNYSLDADDRSLQGGLPAAPVSVIDHYTVSWEYWY
jgi:hypothetical protein